MTATTAPTINRSSRKRHLGWIGVDFGTDALKIAQIVGTRGQWSLAAHFVVPTAQPGQIGLSPGVASLLSESAAFDGSRAVCSLPLSAAELRTVELPPGSDDELRKMISQELGASAGFVNDQREFDFWELEGPPSSDGMHSYAVLSVSRQLAQDVADDLLQAGLKCEAIDGIPFAIARAVEMNKSAGQPEIVAAIDWGFTSVTFVVAAGGKPIFVRKLRDCEFGLIVKRMETELGLTPQECYPLLVNYGLPHLDGGHPPTGLQEAVGSFVAEPLACLVDELSRTMSFAGRQLRKRSPQSLILMGGGATINNAAEQVAGRLQQPVERWGMPARPNSISSLGENQTALFGIAAGLSQLGAHA